MLSGAWTVELCQGQSAAPAPGSVTLSATSASSAPGVPATGAVPPAFQPPVQIPATPLTSAPALGGSASPVTAADTTSTIPAVALAAYQRAATVMNTADASCHLPWQLLAAIGEVESGNGQAQGNRLTSKGVDTPGIFGPVLNGKGGTTRVKDTDGGSLDGNKSFDRAVGPMQFIPSTWSMVAVDADGDGKRNPQDINDASLATAAYLCAGKSNLANMTDQRRAVFRYNHSWPYVRLVLAVEAAYKNGGTTLLDVSPDTTLPATDVVTQTSQTGGHQGRHHSRPGSRTNSKSTRPGLTSTSPSPSSGGRSNATPSSTPSSATTSSSSPSGGTPATNAQLKTLCTKAITQAYPDALPVAKTAAVKKCVQVLSDDGDTVAQAKAALPDLVTQLGTEIDGLEPTPSADPSPTPSPTPSPDPSPSPSSDPSPSASDSPSTSGSDSGSASDSGSSSADPSASASTTQP